MAGLIGVVRVDGGVVSGEVLGRMASSIRYRGLERARWYVGARVGLVELRHWGAAAIGGGEPALPLRAGGRVTGILAGELYNSAELALELEARGHYLFERSATEVVVAGYAAWGWRFLERLEGQFALALYDARDGSVLLARDRFGAAPLYYALRQGDLYFGSEAKSLFASGEVEAAVDLRGLDEVFTFWTTRAPRTPFRGVWQVEPGSWVRWRRGRVELGRYHEVSYAEAASEPCDAVEALDSLLRASVARRLGGGGVGVSGAPGPEVGGYLSGGLDSSIVCALAAGSAPGEFRTFSISFEDTALDERPYQELLADHLGARHEIEAVSASEVGSAFPEVIRHAETPLVRTAPVPLYLLARRARADGVGAVLTGEGADEVFLGYDLFKEVSVRRFCLRAPGSLWRPLLFDRLYPYLGVGGRGGEFWRRYFLDSGPESDPLFSHLPRFGLTSRIKEYYSAEMLGALRQWDPLEELRSSLPVEFGSWSAHNRAAYLEATILLPGYLLSSQGERMTAAHGVLGRHPFLDGGLFDYASALPVRSKLRVLEEKAILRRWARRVLPAEISERPKQPYRAPDIPAFFAGPEPAYLAELLEPEALRRVGVFDSSAVAGLLRRCRSGRAVGFRESQALVAILSTQLWHSLFIQEETTWLPSTQHLGSVHT